MCGVGDESGELAGRPHGRLPHRQENILDGADDCDTIRIIVLHVELQAGGVMENKGGFVEPVPYVYGALARWRIMRNCW